MISKYGNIKLTDFKLSKMLQSHDETTLTRVGVLFYAAPEMLARKPYRYEVDFWSLGVLGFYCFAKDYIIKVDNLENMDQEIATKKPNFDHYNSVWPPNVRMFLEQVFFEP